MKRILALMIAICAVFTAACSSEEKPAEKAENTPAVQNEDVVESPEKTEPSTENTGTEEQNGEKKEEEPENATENLSAYEKIYKFITENGTADGDDYVYQKETAGATFTMVAMPDGKMAWGSESDKALTVIYIEDGASQFRTECTATISAGTYTGEATVSTLDTGKISELDDFVTNAPAAIYDTLQSAHTLYVKSIISIADTVVAQEGVTAADIMK